MIIAIDGPAASGKGTLGKRLAEHYRFAHLDTGLLYRAVARVLMDRDIPLTDRDAAAEVAQNLDVSHLDDDSRLRGAAMGEAASVVSAYQPVRDALLAFQRLFAAQEPGAVLRFMSRSSRRRISTRMVSYSGRSPRISSSRCRRRALSSGAAVMKSFTCASGQTTVPMSRPSSTAPGSCMANWRWKARSASRTGW